MNVSQSDSVVHDQSQEALPAVAPNYSAFAGLSERSDWVGSLLKCNVQVIALIITQAALGAVGWNATDTARIVIAAMMLLFGSIVFFMTRSDTNAPTSQNRAGQPTQP